MPGNARKGKSQLLGQESRDLRAAIAQRGECADGSAEFDDQRPFDEGMESLAMFEAGVEPARCDKTEGSGKRVLQPGSRDHDTPAMGRSQGGQSSDEVVKIPQNGSRGGANLQYQAGVQSVLAGRA